MWAASNSHSPNRCRMLLHLGRCGVSGGRDSVPMDAKAVGEKVE